MSIFSVLRYPISDPPTGEELAALPPDLFTDWKLQTTWRFTYNRQSPKLIADFYLQHTRPSWAYNEVQLLRQMIKDYDEPI